MDKYSILLVDDHQILLEGTKNLINTNPLFEVKDTANSGEAALDLLTRNEYDVLITDYEMGDGVDGGELITAARAVLPEIKVIVLSMHDDKHIVRELLQKGVNGYVLKKDTHETILEAVDKVVAGKRFLSDDIAELLIEGIESKSNNELTPREEEIVRMIIKEYNSKQIADILFISERTVETHRKNIMKKTECSNLVALTKYAYKHNLA